MTSPYTYFYYQLTKGSLVSLHAINMMGYTKSLGTLGFALLDELATNVILQHLSPSYDPHIDISHEQHEDLGCVAGILNIVEENIKKNSNHVMMVQKDIKKWKHFIKGKAKDKISKPNAKLERVQMVRGGEKPRANLNEYVEAVTCSDYFPKQMNSL